MNEVVTDISLGGDQQSVSTVGSSVYNTSFRMSVANPNADFAMSEKDNDADADRHDGASEGKSTGGEAGTQDPATKEAEDTIAREKEEMYKQNAAKLQDVLASIKNSTKTVLGEMNHFLAETADVEQTFVRCRANTQRESARLDGLAPNVSDATQNSFQSMIANAASAGGNNTNQLMAFMMANASNGAGAGDSAGDGFGTAASAVPRNGSSLMQG
mmetsp:Transcript_38570/g.92309  ORF Transcript_38570/g.92309 Transcript_38570/m.92309 type:complete len:215 (-) Transcript_38570:1165-1809(-)